MGIKDLPPEDLMADCLSPVVTYRTNGELALAVGAWQHALKLCNVDKASLREWAKIK